MFDLAISTSYLMSLCLMEMQDGNNLNGTIPTEIGELKELLNLDFGM